MAKKYLHLVNGGLVAQEHLLNDTADVDADSPEGGDRLAWDPDDLKWVPRRSLSALGIMELEYTMALPPDSTPSARHISRDNDPALATKLYLHERDQSNADISLLIAEMRAGDWLNLHKKRDTDIFEKYDVIAAPVKNGDIWEIPVEPYEQSTGSLSDGTRTRLLWRIQGTDTDNYREPMASGVHHGGKITKQTGLDVFIESGRGIIVDAYTNPFKIKRKDITWNDQTVSVTPLDTDTQELHLIYIDDTGSVISTPVQDIGHHLFFDFISLGWAEIYKNEIIGVVDAPYIIGQSSSDIADIFYALKDASKSRGMRIQPCDNVLSIYREKGALLIPSINWYSDKKNKNILEVDQAGDNDHPISFTVFNINGESVIESQTIIPKYFDDNGIMTPLTGGEAAIHYVYFSTIGHGLQLGQTRYASFADAFRNLTLDHTQYVFAPGANVTGRSILLGQVIVSKLAHDFNNKALADIVSTINDESGNTLSPIDLTLVPQYLLHTGAAENLSQGDELSMDVNGNLQKYPATGGEGDIQYTMDNVNYNAAVFLNNSNNQGVISWVNDYNPATLNFVMAQGNPDGSITYSPPGSFNTSGNISCINICKIDTSRAGLVYIDTSGVNLCVIQNNGTGSAPTSGTKRNIDNNTSTGGDVCWDTSEDNLVCAFAVGDYLYNRYCTISGNNVNSPPYGRVGLNSCRGTKVRCVSEGNNVIATSVYNGSSHWVEAAWNKPFWGTGRYDDITNVRSLGDCTNHCGLKVQTGSVLSQFWHNNELQTYVATYSSGSSMGVPSNYSTPIIGKSGDLIQTDSGIGYTTVLKDSGVVEIYEGTMQGAYQLVYSTALNLGTDVEKLQSLMFGSVFALGVLGDYDWANKVIMVDSAATRTDHFLAVAPYNVLQGQRFSADIALPLITLPREYPPGTTYNYGPYKYQVITHNQAVIIIESTIMQVTA